MEKSNQQSAISNQPNAKLSADKLSADRSGSAKDPAAVALGKRRIAKMTPEEALEFHRAGAKAVQAANRKRSPIENHLSRVRAWRTRRMRTAWMAKATLGPTMNNTRPHDEQPSAGSPPAPAPDVSELARLLDAASDKALARLRSAMIAPWNSVTNSVR